MLNLITCMDLIEDVKEVTLFYPDIDQEKELEEKILKLSNVPLNKELYEEVQKNFKGKTLWELLEMLINVSTTIDFAKGDLKENLESVSKGLKSVINKTKLNNKLFSFEFKSSLSDFNVRQKVLFYMELKIACKKEKEVKILYLLKKVTEFLEDSTNNELNKLAKDIGFSSYIEQLNYICAQYKRGYLFISKENVDNDVWLYFWVQKQMKEVGFTDLEEFVDLLGIYTNL